MQNFEEVQVSNKWDPLEYKVDNNNESDNNVKCSNMNDFINNKHNRSSNRAKCQQKM